MWTGSGQGSNSSPSFPLAVCRLGVGQLRRRRRLWPFKAGRCRFERGMRRSQPAWACRERRACDHEMLSLLCVVMENREHSVIQRVIPPSLWNNLADVYGFNPHLPSALQGRTRGFCSHLPSLAYTEIFFGISLSSNPAYVCAPT